MTESIIRTSKAELCRYVIEIEFLN